MALCIWQKFLICGWFAYMSSFVNTKKKKLFHYNPRWKSFILMAFIELDFRLVCRIVQTMPLDLSNKCCLMGNHRCWFDIDWKTMGIRWSPLKYRTFCGSQTMDFRYSIIGCLDHHSFRFFSFETIISLVNFSSVRNTVRKILTLSNLSSKIGRWLQLIRMDKTNLWILFLSIGDMVQCTQFFGCQHQQSTTLRYELKLIRNSVGSLQALAAKQLDLFHPNQIARSLDYRDSNQTNTAY